MSQAQDDLVARASDPNAELTTLHELANNYPGLRPYIAENPRTYPALLEWLGTLGDPAVDAALARRNAGAAGLAGAAGTAAAAAAQPTAVVPGAVPPSYQPASYAPAGSAQPAVSEAAWPAGAAAYGAQGADGGVFGVGTDEAEVEEHRPSNLWLWILGAIVTIGVISLVVWFLSSSHGGGPTQSATTAAVATTSAPATEAAAPAQEETPSATPSPTASATPSTELKAPAPDGAITMSSFSAPSGNITCTLGADSVSCTINDHSFVPAAGDCNGSADSPFTVSVADDGTVSSTCSQAFSATGATLDYGVSAKNDSFACTSTQSWVECWSQKTGKGFTVARADAQTTSR